MQLRIDARKRQTKGTACIWENVTAGRREVEQTSSSLSDARALQLWDEVAASVRPRERAIGTGEIRCRPCDVCLMSGLWVADVAAHMPTSEHWAFHGKDLAGPVSTRKRRCRRFRWHTRATTARGSERGCCNCMARRTAPCPSRILRGHAPAIAPRRWSQVAIQPTSGCACPMSAEGTG